MAIPKGMTIRVVRFEDAEQDIREVRNEVFVHGQFVVPALEWDGEDPRCVQVLALLPSGRAVGTARLLMDGATGKVGRMAVRNPWRGLGVGGAMLDVLTEEARRRGLAKLVADAQTRAIPFYAARGFSVKGPVFMDADIPHRKMFKALEPVQAPAPAAPLTRRQKIMAELESGPHTVRTLAETLEMRVSHVIGELDHAVRSMLRSMPGHKLSVTPARCERCGFSFAKRSRLTRPSRCPRCRGERITDPEFWVE